MMEVENRVKPWRNVIIRIAADTKYAHQPLLSTPEEANISTKTSLSGAYSLTILPLPPMSVCRLLWGASRLVVYLSSKEVSYIGLSA